MRKSKDPPAPVTRAARARILADAAMRGDRPAAEAAGVTAKTIQQWRHDLATDHELDRLYAAHTKRMADGWQPSAARSLAKALEALDRKVDNDQLNAFELVSVVRTVGELLVTHGALAPEEDPDARDAGPGAGEEANARPPAPETKH